MDDPLGKGNFDPGRAKGGFDHIAQFAGDGAPAHHIGGIAAKLEIEAAGAEIVEQDDRSRRYQNLLMRRRQSEQRVANQSRIRSIGDADQDLDPARSVLVGPIGDRGGEKLRIGHDDGGPLEGLDLGGAHADSLHDPHIAADLDPIADLDRPLDQQDQAGDEIVDDILETETDTDRQRARDNRQIGKIDAEHGDPNHRRDDDANVTEPRRERVPDAGFEMGLRQYALGQGSLQHAGQGEQCQENQHAESDFCQRYGHAADREPGQNYAGPAPQLFVRHSPERRDQHDAHE